MNQNCITAVVSLAALIGLNAWGADDVAGLCANRAAIERVYHEHRVGEKPPFEQVLPPDVIQRMVERDEQRERALRRNYGVDITDAQLDAEVRRIEANTRAPEILVELKRALGGDAGRFVRTVVRPALVERELRARFENDATLHSVSRRECEAVRERCLRARASDTSVSRIPELLKQCRAGQVDELAWDLAARAVNAGVPEGESQPHFEDLPRPLRQALSAQLRQPGDISAIIETSDRFLLFVCTSKTTTELKAAALSIAKPNLETWLSTQP